MTEDYWKHYKKEFDSQPFQQNEMWRDIQSQYKAQSKGKHIYELYNICKSDNPYIRQIKNSPNITADTVSELICREVGCDLQYCLSLQRVANNNSKKPVK